VKRFLILCFVLFIAVFSIVVLFSAEKAPDMTEPWKRPENVFTLDSRNTTLVIIDMQNFSCTPEPGEALPRINEVITKINTLADFCRAKGIPVIWVRHSITTTGTGNDAGLYPLFHDPDQLQRITDRGPGTGIYPGMHVDPSRDYMVFKNRYSAFLSDPPELREKLDSLNKTQLIIAGIAANACVESTARDAMQLDYEVILVSDGITATDDALLKSTLVNTRELFGDTRTTADIMKELANSPSLPNRHSRCLSHHTWGCDQGVKE